MPKFKIGNVVVYKQDILVREIFDRPIAKSYSFKIDRIENRSKVLTKLGKIDTFLYLKNGWISGFFEEELELKNQLRSKLLEQVKDETT